MSHPSASLMPREITGEILRDASGRLYEKVGDHVRPVNQLFTGSRGEMIDLAPVREVTRENPRASASRQGQRRGVRRIGRAIRRKPAIRQRGRRNRPDATSRSARQRCERPFRELARRLAPEPGLVAAGPLRRFHRRRSRLSSPIRADCNRAINSPAIVQIYEVAVTIARSRRWKTRRRRARQGGQIDCRCPMTFAASSP